MRAPGWAVGQKVAKVRTMFGSTQREAGRTVTRVDKRYVVLDDGSQFSVRTGVQRGAKPERGIGLGHQWKLELEGAQ